jgi:hypothetical protein
MTPKEKAKELFNNFENVVFDEVDNYYSRRDLSKQCALIAVDEIIDFLPRKDTNSHLWYWKKVKQELKNL